MYQHVLRRQLDHLESCYPSDGTSLFAWPLSLRWLRELQTHGMYASMVFGPAP
jgi:hypothetical protein